MSITSISRLRNVRAAALFYYRDVFAVRTEVGPRIEGESALSEIFSVGDKEGGGRARLVSTTPPYLNNGKPQFIIERPCPAGEGLGATSFIREAVPLNSRPDRLFWPPQNLPERKKGLDGKRSKLGPSKQAHIHYGIDKYLSLNILR